MFVSRDQTKLYDCPVGFRWASTAEGQLLFPSASDSTPGGQKTYFGECGWSGYLWGGVSRAKFRFSDSAVTGGSKNAGFSDPYRPDLLDFTTSEFAGIVCVIDGFLGILAATNNKELWRTDGTVEGTSRVDDINHGGEGSYPDGLTSFDGYLYLAATTGTDGRELYRTRGDGVAPPTIVSYGPNIGIYPLLGSSNPTALTATATKLFFAATDPTYGRELWSVAAGSGTLSFVDIVAGSISSNPTGLCTCGASVVVFAATTTSGTELWASDGSSANTYQVADICAGPGSSSPAYITCFRGLFYFQADDCEHGAELWVSDGLIGGDTHLVRDIRTGSAGSYPAFLTPFASPLDGLEYLIFAATDGLYTTAASANEGFGGSQFWRTDGSGTGTSRALMNTENDLYLDRPQMAAVAPHAMFAKYGMLLVPGTFDRPTVTSSSLSTSTVASSSATNTSILGLSQAVVISDPDTPTTATLELDISAGQGIIVLNYRAGRNSSAFLRFLLADSQAQETLLLFNILEGLGHTVTVVATGTAALSLLTANVSFDCLLLWAGLDSASLDVYQTLRLLRDKFTSAVLPTISFSSDATISAAVLSAGADLYLVEPVLTGTGSADRTNFGQFVAQLLQYFSASASSIVFSNMMAPDASVNTSTLAGNVFARSLTLNGTSKAINAVLAALSYFAPDGSFGADSITFTVRDNPHPEVCLALLQASPLLTNVSAFPVATLCDYTTHNSVTVSIPGECTSSQLYIALLAHVSVFM
jgi:ELWxxDGT repeat protein